MGISASTAAMAFGSGLIKGDEKARLENLKIHSDKLAAKRDAIIAMKKSKFKYDMDKFEKVGALLITIINRDYCKKLIAQLPGQSHPSHYHEKKEETFGNIFLLLSFFGNVFF